MQRRRLAGDGPLRCSISWPRCGTRCANCVRCAQTTATSQSTKRAARAGHELCAPRHCIGAAAGGPPAAWQTLVLPAAKHARTVEAARLLGRCASHRRCQPRMVGKRIREVEEEPAAVGCRRGREPGHKQSGGLFVPGERLGLCPRHGRIRFPAVLGTRDTTRQAAKRRNPSHPPSVPEVSRAGEDHRDTALVGCGDDLVVAHRPAGLDDAGRAFVDDHVQAIAEREEGIAGHR